MKPRFEMGKVVRVIRNVRDDGTFGGTEIGDLLVRRGSTGHVQNVGTFLQTVAHPQVTETLDNDTFTEEICKTCYVPSI